MKIIKKIANSIKNYPYKMITAFGLLTISALLYQKFSFHFLEYIMGACCLFLLGYAYVGIFYAARNTWNDGNKFFALIFVLFSLGLLAFIAFLFLSPNEY